MSNTTFLQEPEPLDREQSIEGYVKLRLQGLDRAVAGYTSVSLQGLTGNVDLTPTQAKHRAIKLTGAPAGAVSLRIPHATGANADIAFSNACTGANSAVTIRSTGANAGNPAGATIPALGSAVVRHDGESAYQLSGADLGFISGLGVEWISGTGIRVKPGAAYVQGRGVLTLAANKDKTGLALAANTTYYIYLYDNAGTVDVEIVTTAPSNYFGNAYQKTGDSSRRFLLALRTQAAAANVIKFRHSLDTVQFLEDTAVAPLRALSAGTATSETDVTVVNNVVPPNAFLAQVVAINTATSGNLQIGNSEDTSASGLMNITPSSRQEMWMATDALQRLRYRFDAAPGGGGAGYIDILGYRFQR